METYIFDLDGTLLDSLPGIELAVGEATFRVLKRRHTDSLRPLIGPPIRQVLQKALSVDDPNILDLLERSFRESYDSNGWRHCDLYPDVFPILADLHADGCRLFILTNKPAHITLKILECHGIKDWFQDIVCLSSPGCRSFASKVDAAMAMAKSHTLVSTATILVGDSVDDAAAAHANKFQFVAAAYGYGKAAVQTEFPIHVSITQFREIPRRKLNPAKINTL